MNQTLHLGAAGVLLSVMALLGCGKSAPSGAAVSAEPVPSASASAAAITEKPTNAPDAPKAPDMPKGPKFISRAKLTEGGTLYWAGAGVIWCPTWGCIGDAYLYTEKGQVDTYDPREAMKVHYSYLFKFGEKQQVQIKYWGDYPEICANYSWWNDRTDFGGQTLKRSGKTWVPDSCSEARYEDPKIPRPPRDLDDALLHAPVAGAASSMIFGAGGPALLVVDGGYHTWDGKVWTFHQAPVMDYLPSDDAKDAPISKRPVRMVNGNTIVPRGGFVIDPQGKIASFEMEHEGKPLAADAKAKGFVWAQKSPWMVVSYERELYLLTAEKVGKDEYTRAVPVGRPPRVAAKKTPALAPTPSAPTSSTAAASASASPSASAPVAASASASSSQAVAPALSASGAASVAPSVSVSATASIIPSASAAPMASVEPTSTVSAEPVSDPNEVGAPKNYTAACTTPFVLLATPPKPGGTFDTTRAGLKGASEFQDIATFVEYTHEGKLYFGVQVKTEETARKFMAAVESRVKGMKPQLTCADVLSKIPDRYSPPEGMRVIGINLTTGELVSLD
ncbi:MAG: hypothetical protein IPK82_24785 [Polyangiaceae bacterium]|nr:hypothetical protein [Polyangiaceae bacterium]